MPKIIIYCPKCRDLTRHRVRADYAAVCYGCGDEVDLDDPKVIQAILEKRGGPEKRV